MDINNPTDLRRAIERLADEEGFVQLGALRVSPQEMQDVTEELIGGLVDAYMNGAQPGPCVSLVGRLLLAEIAD